MKWYLAFIFYSVFTINHAFSMDCNPKQLNAIIEEFAAKIMSNIPITQKQVEDAISYCTIDPTIISPPDEGVLEKVPSTSIEIIKSPETRSNFDNFMSVCNDLEILYPETKNALTLVTQGIYDKIKEIDKQKSHLEIWKQRQIHELSLKEPERKKTKKEEELLDFFANADAELSKKRKIKAENKEHIR